MTRAFPTALLVLIAAAWTPWSARAEPPDSPLARILEDPSKAKEGEAAPAPAAGDPAPADAAPMPAPSLPSPSPSEDAAGAPHTDAPGESTGDESWGAAPDRQPAPGEGVVAKPRVCLALPLSGPHAALGRKTGGLIDPVLSTAEGVGAARYDTLGTPQGAEAAVLRADDEGCTLLIGGIGDREASVVADAAARVGMPAIVLGGEPDERVRPDVVWGRAGRSMRAAVLARHLAQAGVVTAWVLAQDTPYGIAEARAFERAFATVGGRVGGQEWVADEGTAPAEAPAEAAARLAAKVTGARADAACVGEAFLVIDGVAGARRLLGFLGYEGVLQAAGPRCPLPIIAGSALWLEGPELGRTRALDGALVAAVRTRGTVGGLLEAEVLDATDLVAAWLRTHPQGDRGGVMAGLRALPALPGRTGSLRVVGDRVVGKDVQVVVIRRGVPEPVQASPEAGWTSSD